MFCFFFPSPLINIQGSNGCSVTLKSHSCPRGTTSFSLAKYLYYSEIILRQDLVIEIKEEWLSVSLSHGISRVFLIVHIVRAKQSKWCKVMFLSMPAADEWAEDSSRVGLWEHLCKSLFEHISEALAPTPTPRTANRRVGRAQGHSNLPTRAPWELEINDCVEGVAHMQLEESRRTCGNKNLS